MAISDPTYMPPPPGPAPKNTPYEAAERCVSCAAAPVGANGHTLAQQCALVTQAKNEAGIDNWSGVIQALEDAGGGETGLDASKDTTQGEVSA